MQNKNNTSRHLERGILLDFKALFVTAMTRSQILEILDEMQHLKLDYNQVTARPSCQSTLIVLFKSMLKIKQTYDNEHIYLAVLSQQSESSSSLLLVLLSWSRAPSPASMKLRTLLQSSWQSSTITLSSLPPPRCHEHNSELTTEIRDARGVRCCNVQCTVQRRECTVPVMH